jgi:hypothetical protein
MSPEASPPAEKKSGPEEVGESRLAEQGVQALADSTPKANDAVPQQVLDAAAVQQTVEDQFPGLWPAVEAGLSVAATLLLRDSTNPVALIYVGGPSTGKTTVAEMFADHPMTKVSDNFTPAAFVSQAANRTARQLNNVDLLPRIRHKLFITPELAPVFRGKEDELTKLFATITRVLDGQGLQTDSGTHGERGYRGDYSFAWLGCTTPFPPQVWRVMAQLGSRLFFFRMGDGTDTTVADLVSISSATPYSIRLESCRTAVRRFFGELFWAHKVRSVPWQPSGDPPQVQEWIARFATLLAEMRSEPAKDSEVDASSYTPANREQPTRAFAVLSSIARGHALIHGRTQLSDRDLPIVARVAVDTIPDRLSPIFKALAANEGQPLVVAEVQRALCVAPGTARRVIEEAGRREVMEFVDHGTGQPAELRFRDKWAWCASPEFRAILLDDAVPVKNPELCASSQAITPDLAQRQIERVESEESEMEPSGALTPGKLTASAQKIRTKAPQRRQRGSTGDSGALRRLAPRSMREAEPTKFDCPSPSQHQGSSRSSSGTTRTASLARSARLWHRGSRPGNGGTRYELPDVRLRDPHSAADLGRPLPLLRRAAVALRGRRS